MKRSFNAFFLLSELPEKAGMAFTSKRSQSQDLQDQKFGLGKYFFTNYRMREAFDQDPERCGASRRDAMVDARVEHIMA